MYSLKDFINNHNINGSDSALPDVNGSDRALPLPENLKTSILEQIESIATINLSADEKDKFSAKVASIAVSDEVISELSIALGTPKKSESENEFVDRAKSILKSILKSKLKN